jgi:hypothetical protein
MVVIRTCLVAVALGRAKAAEVGNVRVGIDDQPTAVAPEALD